MKIYFCDVCNESIPQEDLAQGRVTTVRGKMICARCVPAAALATPPAASRSSVGAGGLAVLALLVGIGAIVLAWKARESAAGQSELASRIAGVERGINEASASVGDLAVEVHALQSQLAHAQSEPPAWRVPLDEVAARAQKSERELGELRDLLGNLRSDREAFQRLELKQGSLEHDVAEARSQVRELQGRLESLGTPAAGSPAPSAPAAAPTAKNAIPVFDDETKKQIANLSHPEPGVRWTAVDNLAKKHDAQLIPYFLPVLDDADGFVRYRVIDALRELNARVAVRRLIKLLGDSSEIVRDQALEALVTLTGNPQRFDVHKGTPAERDKGIKAWEAWYEKNKERFEPPPPTPPAGSQTQ